MSRVRAVLTSVALVAVVLTVPWDGGAVSAAGGSSSPAATRLSVNELRTEYAHNPLGLDVERPRLSWVLTSTERGQRQTAYRILVASSPARLAANEGDVWDSGRVTSADSINVPYAGPDLASMTRYHWKVRVWDKDGDQSRWSPPAWWETAMLHPSDWSADWIGQPVDDPEPPPDLNGSSWIWFPEGDPGTTAPPATRYFRRAVPVPDGQTVASARLLLTVDDAFRAYLNGREVARNVGTWQQAVTVDLTERLQSGRNVIALAGTNSSDGPAGAIGVLEIRYADGTTQTVRTNAQWKAYDIEAPDWTSVDFDDSGWPAALDVAPYGQGPWTCCGGVNTDHPPSSVDPLLRKEFSIAKPIERARVSMVGLGYHELRINGAKVGDRVLEGDVNDYTKRVGYSTYDVTSHLTKGANAVGVMLGRGFYDVHQSTPLDWHRAPWRDDPKLLFQMRIDYADGTHETITSDSTWRVVSGPVVYDSVFGGEDYDARLERPGWDRPAYDASAWSPVRLVDAPAGRLVAINNDPVEVIDTLRPAEVTEPKDDVYVLDLGQTITGWGRLTVSGEAGTTVTMRYGQRLLSDGTVDYGNGWHGGRSQTDSYVLKGDGTEVWEPRFSFKSFRYLQVTGLSSRPEGDTVVGRSVHSAVKSDGVFDSSNELYNTFHDGMRRTITGNLLGYPAVDPYFEKSGWTEDVFVAAQSMIDNYDLARLLGEWLEDIRDSQRPNGHLPIIIPSPGWGYDSWGTPSPIWTAVYPIIAWRLYENYGDRRQLARHYPAIARYIDREVALLDDGIVAAEFLGDWIPPGYGAPPEDPKLASTAYVYRQLMIVADMAEVLGRDGDAAGYREQARFVRERFNATYFDDARGYYVTAKDPGYRQTSNLLPLAFGMVPASQERRVVESVVADIRARGNHLNTGTLGTEVILPVLTEHGYVDLAHAIANQRTYPSWGYWYANGADTMWESWELTSRSRAHFFMGTVEEWLFEDVAGIGAGEAGCRDVVIRPRLGGGLDEATASYDSGYGRIRSAWETDGAAVKLAVTVPVNTTATVYVPTGDPESVTESGAPAGGADGVRFVGVEDGHAVYEVGSGRYRFAATL